MRLLALVHPDFAATQSQMKISIKLCGRLFYFILGIDNSVTKYELGKTDVLIRKIGFSLNYRDLGLMTRASQYFDESGDRRSYFPVGSDFVGEIIEMGSDVKDLNVGDRVIPNWEYCEPLKQRDYRNGISSNCTSKEIEIFHEKKLMQIPKDFPIELAAGFTIGAQTAISMLTKAKLGIEKTVLITSGSSSTSYFFLNFLSTFKYKKVFVLTSSDDKVKKIRSLNIPDVEVILNRPSVGEGAVESRIVESLRNSIDVILDPFSTIYLPVLYQVLRFNGKYLTCGIENVNLSGNKDINSSTLMPAQLFIHFIMNNIQLEGNCLGNFDDLAKAVKLVSDKSVSLIPYKYFQFEDSKAFLEASFNDCQRFGKTMCMYE